jgi:ABC-type taurine transport system ATPase subunit
MATIEVRDLTKRYGPVLAVDRLSFAVERGTVMGFLGPNGAGKTTTLRMLLGLVEPTAGAATINGAAYRDLSDPLHHVGAVLEASSFHPGRTARNHLRVQALAGGIRRARVEEMLDLIGLQAAADRRVGDFSLHRAGRWRHHAGVWRRRRPTRGRRHGARRPGGADHRPRRYHLMAADDNRQGACRGRWPRHLAGRTDGFDRL